MRRLQKPKKCPFCRSKDIEVISYETSYQVICNSCGAGGPIIEDSTDDERYAIIGWNSRPRKDSKTLRNWER
jgi:hypothetical protein